MSTLPPHVLHTYLDAQLVAAFVELFLDGVYTTLVVFMFLIIGTSKRTLSLAEYIIYLVIFLLYAMAMIHVGSWTFHMRDAFINHTGPTETIYAFLSTKDPQALGRDIMAVAMTLVADLILVWRVFSLWGSNWKVGILPLVLTLFALGTKLLPFILSSYPPPFSHSIYIAFGIQYIWLATNPSELVSLKRIDVDSGTYYGATLANTVVSTILIIWRIHSIGGTEGVAKYWHVLGMVVESAALYSIVLIIYMPFVTGTDYATHAATYIVQSVVIPMTGIAPTLLVTRVLLHKENSTPHPFMDSIRSRFMTVSLAFSPPTQTGDTTNINSHTQYTQSRTPNPTVKDNSRTELPPSLESK
ncbi:hypothetical protein K435DRAFT_970009 [Dendrothele bispora CBS 962.96]|uniref:Family A G protein-coupled receptor-like protein n=1 Tax=Dendrothele bispora (strain CBS 962.96) TaxID=1314807 RepID=A0A4S8LE38_DENBC|nr:hypothetical protein K435DRAFT_970009 [Dendrothele bispora CBS 962.96]